MGLVLDSGVLIDAERNATPVSSLLADLALKHGEAEIVLSVISVIELEHGLACDDGGNRRETACVPR